MKKLKVDVDIAKNRLYFTVSGSITKKELDSFYTEIRFSVADLQPGFQVVSDYSTCKLAHLGTIATFRKITSFLIRSGLSDVVRIIPKNAIISRQIMQLAARFQGYSPICVYSREEAEQTLDRAEKRNGPQFHLHRLPIKYKIDTTTGEGAIDNISTDGCEAVFSLALPLTVDMEIVISFSFTEQENSTDPFEIKARVTGVKDDTFAAEFKELATDEKERLWNCLVCEVERET